MIKLETVTFTLGETIPFNGERNFANVKPEVSATFSNVQNDRDIALCQEISTNLMLNYKIHLGVSNKEPKEIIGNLFQPNVPECVATMQATQEARLDIAHEEQEAFEAAYDEDEDQDELAVDAEALMREALAG